VLERNRTNPKTTMTISVALHHVTDYRYDQPVQLGPQVVRLRPAPHCRTPVSGYRLKIEPAEHFCNWQQDPLGNWQARLVFPKPTDHFRVEVDLVAEMTVINPFDFFLEDSAEECPFTYDPALATELAAYRVPAPMGPKLTEWMTGVDMRKRRTVDFLVDLNRRLYEGIRYLIRLEPGVQTPEETLEKGSGSCRDSAWLLVQACRQLGLAARFVSGYLIQLAPDVKAIDGPSGPVTDFTDLHAWCEIYLPGAGWVGLDPTSGLMAGEGHLPLACSAEPITAAPISGGFTPTRGDEAECAFGFEMAVTRLPEMPRQTKPYTEEQWLAIDAAGRAVDAALMAEDVRLTVGGEPTFVSIDDPDGPEWTVGALGERKRTLAGTLFRRLRDRFAPGAFLHFGQGKWYPGEQLPRWALGCWWRKDGEPIWRDPTLIATDGVSLGHDAATAARFIRALAQRLDVPDTWIMPGYEDAFYYLWRERCLPVNVDPYKSRLEDAQERARLTKVFSQGLDAVIGYTMPLRRHPFASGWQSGPWFLRDERLRLLPGDSSMGYRLPLESLPWGGGIVDDSPVERDPTEQRQPLPRFQTRERQGVAQADAAAPKAQEPYGPLVRTALCIEPRDGQLKVFMPPVPLVEDYLELVTLIEDTAAALGTPVQIEGYRPPHDPRLRHFAITPDPGVIEVNIQPAGSWDELSDITHVVYEEARQARLAAEKFMLDGRHTGTGGGNHITMGGATPADSPFLRRPDVLRSLVAYWHNHPSLSYLFSGLFIGPTSQAPRADEARTETTYELELGLKQLPDRTPVAPWQVDRALRHLLVDLTGNTHRAEFSIDKLYSPDHAAGRLGLVEMRGFEMPPHPRMAMAQHLLLRSLVARFWKQPYQQRLVRWGTELHDRWMLPAVIDHDLHDVVDELGAAGFPLDPTWFAPHHEFRFPVHGTLSARGLTIELRQALEPWHVLGEETTGSGTARYVDSSLERVQVHLTGATDGRHVVTCNGRLLPLHPSGTRTGFIAGVRYRAWQPPSCLHPTIGSHAPLVFDVVDTWNGRAVAGCTYHVAHPGGRSFETFPVNANEAESRRAARFQAFGHTPGSLSLPPLVVDPDYPYTLDLRA
jgi:uncharacterized protein (DUF2126 family)/transglutaminase-like putative cysteine protease